MAYKSINPFELMENFFQQIGREWMLITAAHPDGSTNTMTAAWGGIGFIWQQPVVFIFIRPQRFTKNLVETSSTFSLTFFNSEYRDTLLAMGSITGYDDAKKVAHSGLTLAWHETSVQQDPPLGAGAVEKTPYFSEARLALFCERLYQQDMLSDNFLDTAQLEQHYGKLGDENDLHTLYIAGIRDILLKS